MDFNAKIRVGNAGGGFCSPFGERARMRVPVIQTNHPIKLVDIHTSLMEGLLENMAVLEGLLQFGYLLMAESRGLCYGVIVQPHCL